ncbi:MAG: glycosyltransferase family 4 protein, partial [Deltaproteobacteria bacterium]
ALALITSGRLHHGRFKRISGKPLEDLYPACFPNREFTPYARREKAMLAYDRWDIGNKPLIFLDLLEKIDEGIKLKIGGFWHPEAIKDEFVGESERRKLKSRIELLGPLDENMILGLCSRVMLHLHPNEEAFGMQTLEAAACGCCVIIPAGSGVTDLFEHGIHGFFPEKGNLPELINYVKTVFEDTGKAEKMGRMAWETAKKHTWAAYAERLEGIIKEYADAKN